MTSATGVWQCGNYLVVDTAQSAFPDCCPWTNQDVDTGRISLEFKAELPFEWRYSLLNGIGEFRTFKIPMAVSPLWNEPRDAGKKRIGKIIFRVGLVLGLCSAAGFAWLYQIENPNAAEGIIVPMVIAVGTFPFAIIGMIIGLAWPHLEGTPGAGGLIAAKLTDERFLWIEGTHPQFRERLPAWPGQKLDVSFASRESFREYIANNWPYIVIAFLFWAAIIVAKAYFKHAVLK